MNVPADQVQRDRFISELDVNFSVIASAGSGKTRAITDRIVALARRPQAEEWLPTLVVVTYTNRAADEMQQRARQGLLEANVPLAVHAAFSRAFFGTIHSFCVRLLRQHGHLLGLPAQFEPLDDDTELWREFVQHQSIVGASLSEAQRRDLFRLAPARRLLELGRLSATHLDAPDPGAFPVFDFADVHAQLGNGTTRHTIEASQQRLREWENAWREGGGFVPLPMPSSKAAAFATAWRDAIEPLRGWSRRAALRVAVETARAYREFRTSRGVLTFDDQVALARELLRHPEAGARLRTQGQRVLLDEAQDTDPLQFAVLLELARPPEATGDWLEVGTHPPRPGHFCMVGDFQQSIYGARADLTHYRQVHETLLRTQAARELEFSVTFRLDQQSLDFVNTSFARVLDHEKGQVDYVTLSLRPGVLPGQVVCGDLGELPDLTNWTKTDKARYEARWLARWLRAAGLEKLRARSWRDVAILCPRKGWFTELRTALRAEGLAVQLQSERDLKADSPAFAWFTALVICLAEPRNGFELAGVLREVFGVSDHELSDYTEGCGERLQIVAPPAQTGAVATALRLLAETRERTAGWPVFSAIRELVAVTRLSERLRSLPQDDFGDLAGELEDLLTRAATEEADGATLTTFADRLRRDFTTTRDVRNETREAVQLITGQKAKGSEWSCVIVPFLAHEIRAASPSYPRLVRDPATGQWLIALEKHDVTGELKDALDTRQRQEMERLLYVTCTRAKHTLVLVDDRALFTTKSGPPRSSQARLLRAAEGEPNASVLDLLPTELAECATTRLAQTQRADARETIEPLTASLPADLDAARTRAVRFIKRNPSSFAEAAYAGPAPSPARLAPSPGALHGIWWHSFVEQLDWCSTPESWASIFERHHANAPDPALAQAEWTRLLAQLTSKTEIARALRGADCIAHAELPFMWRMSDDECLEGIIDLAVFNPARGTWLILDWKTNRARPDELKSLQAHYEPQLAAYWQALTQMTGGEVEAGIFSTDAGVWLPYGRERLSAVWASLAKHTGEIAHALALE
jgi:ATP-dependent exoDNAse (exonuclease V) beta subunit